MRKDRILIINNEFPPIGAGAGNASYHMAKNIVRLGGDVTVLTSAFDNLAFKEEKEGFLVERVACRRKDNFQSNVLEFLSFAWNAYRYIKKDLGDGKREYSVSICFHAIPSGIVSYMLFRKYGIPYIVLLRGGDVPGFLPERLRFHHWISMPFTKLIWKNASSIVANSRGLQELAEGTAAKIGKDVTIIRNGVDLYSCDEIFEKSRSNELKLVFAGRLDQQKGLDYLIDAVAGMPFNDRDRIIVEIIGSGPARARLQRIANNVGLDNIKFLGHLSKKDLVRHLRQADIFVLPSLYEGMSNSLLEAMAVGLPAIVTDIMGNNELVIDGRNGFVVPPRSSESLKGAIRRVLEEPELLEVFGQNNRITAAKYDWLSSARQLYDLIPQTPVYKSI